jgi:hypothetical protein
MNGRLPGFMRRAAPLSSAVEAIERGVARRSARVWAPRWVGAMLLARGLLQPLNERAILSDPSDLVDAMRTAESSGESTDQDPVLGVAAKALD